MNQAKTISRPEMASRLSRKATQRRSAMDNKALDEAQRRLQASGYRALRSISCEYHEGMFVLRGKVPSFYMKQVAQELVRSVEGVSTIVNCLEVSE